MKWHRNPFFHTAVLPPSVAPSAMTSARPSADLDGATAAATRAAALRSQASSTRPSMDARASLDVRASLDAGASLGVRENRDKTSTLAAAPPAITFSPPPDNGEGPHSAGGGPGILVEAANRVHAAQSHGPVGLLRSALGNSVARRRPKVPKLTILEPTDHLTPYQAFYIFGLDGLGAFLLSGGINFAIAYAMYKTIDTDRHPIRVFEFPNTLVGDAVVTTFIQTVMTWFIELVLVNRDLRGGTVQPVGFIPEPSNRLVRWFLLLDRRAPAASDADSSDDNDMRRPLSAPHDENCRCGDDRHIEQHYAPGSWQHWAAFLVSQLLRALLVGVAAFVVLIGPTIGLLIAAGDKRGGDWSFDGTSWAPPLFKLIYGGVLALLTTPPFAAFWLVRCGWAVQANQRHLEAGLANP